LCRVEEIPEMSGRNLRIAYLNDFTFFSARKLLTHGLRVSLYDRSSPFDASLAVKLVVGSVRENDEHPEALAVIDHKESIDGFAANFGESGRDLGCAFWQDELKLCG
jgi:hypothetical protein